MVTLSTGLVNDINTIAEYLAQDNDMPSIQGHGKNDQTAIVLVGSAILPTMRAVFDYLSKPDTSPITLVLCGGIGHSTHLLRSAVTTSFSAVSALEIADLPESRIFERAMQVGWPDLCERVLKGEIRLLVEKKSTNCGANAIEAIHTMRANDVWPDRLVVIQDPTMMRRTVASFDKVYLDLVSASDVSTKVPIIAPWSTFTPRLALDDDTGLLNWNITDFASSSASISELWTNERFLELLMGEMTRLNDDEDGYGPAGKGFIGHVKIPNHVIGSWRRLKKEIGGGRQAEHLGARC
jgi:hypothetical protein